MDELHGHSRCWKGEIAFFPANFSASEDQKRSEPFTAAKTDVSACLVDHFGVDVVDPGSD